MKLTRINDGIADRDTCFNLLNRYQGTIQNREENWTPNPNHMELKAGQFFEITHEEYWYFLEVLPPLYQSGGAFAMSEFIRGDLTNAFFEFVGRFFCVTIAVDCENSVEDVISRTWADLADAIGAEWSS